MVSADSRCERTGYWLRVRENQVYVTRLGTTHIGLSSPRKKSLDENDNLAEPLMIKSPGHQQQPDHHLTSRRLAQRMSVTVAGEVIAQSSNVLRLDEDGQPPRFYFPRADVDMSRLRPSTTASTCPFKGTARYFDVLAQDDVLEGAVWSYEDPYEEHRNLEGRLAFYDDKIPALHLGGAAMQEEID